MQINILCLAAWGLFAAGDIPALGDIGSFAQLGSVGVLLWIVKMFFASQNADRAERMRLMEMLIEKDDESE
jgi:hypothetical protein